MDGGIKGSLVGWTVLRAMKSTNRRAGWRAEWGKAIELVS